MSRLGEAPRVVDHLWLGRRKYGGFSVNSGMVIDVSELDHMVVDPANKFAHVSGPAPSSMT